MPSYSLNFLHPKLFLSGQDKKGDEMPSLLPESYTKEVQISVNT